MRAVPNSSRGSITLVALSLAIVIGISLGSYIALCNQSLILSSRTLQLSKARQLAETGLEEALWSLNANANPDTSVSATAWTNAVWTTTGLNKTCTISGYDLGDGATGEVNLTVANFNGPTATPTVPNPIITAVATVSLPGLSSFTKTITATTRPAPLFANALGIPNANNGTITFNNTGSLTSWNSGDPDTTCMPGPFVPYSFTAGAAVNYVAGIAAPNITLNNANVRGYANTFGNIINSTGSSKVRGPTSVVNLDPARMGKSAFVPIFAVNTPTGSAYGNLDACNPPSVGTNSDASIGAAGTYRIYEVSSNLMLNGHTITVDGHVTLRVPGHLTIINGAKIIVNAGGQLEVYVAGNVQIGEAGGGSTAGFDNQTSQPKNLALFSVAASRAFQYQSSQSFCGVIYSAAPGPINATVQFQPSTPANPTIYGAILANYNIALDSGGTLLPFRYDTALQYLPKGWFKGVATPYLITRLTETP